MAEDTRDNLSLTDDENDDDIDDDYHLPELAGTLCKWTNYIHGWQDRYIVLKDGTLSYYKSETETSFGCRGAVSLAKSIITPHEFDECRFDVSVNDCLWYLRTRNAEEKQQWIDMLDLHRQADSGYGSENGLRRHGSMLSLTSAASLSTASASSFKKGRGLREKLAEMETFRDILCRQVDTLQSYFDACASAVEQGSVHDLETDDIEDDPDDLGVHKQNGHGPTNNRPGPPNHVHSPPNQVHGSSNHVHGQQNHVHGSSTNDHTPANHTMYMDLDSDRDYKDIANILQQHGAHAIDFKGEAFTFKATTAGILATLSHCIELMMQREDAWRKRLEKEYEKRKRIQDAYRAVLDDRPKTVVIGGPDFEEGPHSIMHEEEFFDAVDATLDKLDREEEKKKALAAVTQQKTEKLVAPPPATSLEPTHQQYTAINAVVSDHLLHADMQQLDNSWSLIAEDGEMKVYKRELEENGMVVDPLKAVHTVKGITGHEMCQLFWDPAVRMEWEGTLDSSTVVEWLSRDTVVTYQVHKRVWPATQRDSLFWSTIRHVSGGDDADDDTPDYWMVVNHSTEHEDVQPVSGKCVRIKFNVAMICQTVVQPPEKGQEIKRDNLTCKIQYSANVNPGGWAPASVIRVISKRELPKFLKTFTNFVIQKTKDKPILF